jgi:hypothetical protein
MKNHSCCGSPFGFGYAVRFRGLTAISPLVLLPSTLDGLGAIWLVRSVLIELMLCQSTEFGNVRQILHRNVTYVCSRVQVPSLLPSVLGRQARTRCKGSDSRLMMTLINRRTDHMGHWSFNRFRELN